MMKRIASVTLVAVLALTICLAMWAHPVAANEITPMQISDEMIDLIKEMEGFDAVPFWDYSQWTVGFGSTCPNEDLERYREYGITPEEAHTLMLDQMSKFVTDVNDFMVRKQIQLTQNQFDAMVSFVYNVGSSVLRNDNSTVIKAIVNGAEGNDFMFAIGQWCSAGGDFLYGLMRRRMMEANIYLYGTYSKDLPESYCYVKFDANGGNRDCRAQAYDSNMPTAPMSAPTREGYTFLGWFTAPTGGSRVTALDETTNGITLYAQWELGTLAPNQPTDPESGVEVQVTSENVYVRLAPGITNGIVTTVYKGEKLLITGLTEKGGSLWGRCGKGWIALEHTNYYELTGTGNDKDEAEESVEVPIYATVLSTAGVKVYKGPHTTYPEVGTLPEGQLILIEESVYFCKQLWGRYEGGWVQLNQRILIHDDQVLAHRFTATVTYYYLNVRSGPGTNYGSLMSLNKGDKIEIFSVVIVDGIPWGRFISGWVYLANYTDFDISKLDYYRDHSYGEWYESKQASCAEYGQERRDCLHCDHYEVRKIEMVDHVLGDWYEFQAGTCVSNAQERKDCENCAYYEIRETELGDHAFEDWYVSREATCVEVGQESRDCIYCDHVEVQDTTLGDHKWMEWTETLAPGCETVGQEQRNCENCEHFETREVEALGHSYGEWTETLAPGCETIGQEQRNCENCEHFETREVEALGHSYDEWYETVTPDADNEGEARRDCQRCEYYETKILEKNPHIYGEWYVYIDASCTAAGEERRDCQHCELYESRPIEIIEHNLLDWYIHQAATCVAPGEERRDCEACDHYESREITILDHSYGDWYIHQTATCVAPGEERRDCEGCDHYESREITILDHSYGEWYTHQEATCVALGEERRDCEACDHYESREIQLAAHDFDEWYVFQAPDCVTAGEERRECRICQHHENREILALDHNLGDWFVFQEASCTAVGEERRACDRCDYYESRDVDLLDHSYSDWYVVQKPTIDDEGVECRECVHCDAEQMRSVPVLPSVEKVYALVTYSQLNVRASAYSGAKKMGTINSGMMVEILEQVKTGNNTWGRMEYGWICLTGYTEVITVREELVDDRGDKTYATITCNYLSIRPQPNASLDRLGTIQNGARVRIYEQQTIGTVTWGRTALGWIWLTGYTSIEVEKGEHLEHTYGDWYATQPGSCIVSVQERRDCTECDHYETREGAFGEHAMEQWYVVQEPTCAMSGQQRRDCQLCDYHELQTLESTGQHTMDQWITVVAPTCQSAGQSQRKCLHCDYFETQVIDMLEHNMGTWYVVNMPTCERDGQQFRDCADCHYSESKDIPAMGHQFGQWVVTAEPGCEEMGQQRRECQNCGSYETESISAVGHSFGDWVVIKEATAIEMGQERRNCSDCDHYETRTIDRLNVPAGKAFGTFTGNGYLNIRNGAGMGYTPVGRLYPNNRVEIYEMVDVDGKTWGRIEEGWVCITGYISVEFETRKLYATVTYDYLTIRAGSSSSTGKIGTLDKGDVVEILEIVSSGRNSWGRIAEGWICLTGYTVVHTAYEVTDEGQNMRICATVTYQYLTIRADATSSAENLGTLNKGDRVEILEIVFIGNREWGRTADGWICLTSYVVLDTVE